MTPPAEQNWSHLALLRLNAFGVGINGYFLAIDTVILPVLVLVLVPEALKNTLLGTLGFCGLIVAAVTQVVIGRISDRTTSPLGRRVPFLIWGCAFVCLGMVGVGFAPNYWVLFGVWLFIQANINVGYGPYQALIQDFVPTSRTGVASAFKILADAVGGVAFIKISSVFMGNYDNGSAVEWLWIALAVLGINLIVFTGITSATVLTRKSGTGGTKDISSLPASATSRLHPQISLFLLSRLLLVTAVAAFQTYGLFFLRDKVGLDNAVQDLGNMILLVGGALAVSVYPAGWLSDRVGRKPVVLAGAAGAAVTTLWMLTAGTASEVLLIATCIGFSVGTLLSANWALANDLGTAGQEARHMGVVNLSTIGGAALAKLLGPGIDLMNRTSAASGYSTLLVGCAALFVIGGLLLMPLKTTLPIRPSSDPSS
ncbi:MAG: MFS transporter [Chloroflexi bacterium]|nr:MFS transporter [Chloroflexota bacterium]